MWTCAVCGEQHDELAMVFGPAAPDAWVSATDEQRSTGELGEDRCVITLHGTEHYFVRGHIEIPVVDADDVFVWVVWCSLSRDSMLTTVEHWEDPDREHLPPMFGWLNTRLPYDEPTLEIATHVHTRAPGLVPLIELDPAADHQLVREQRAGISRHRVAEINRSLPGDPGSAEHSLLGLIERFGWAIRHVGAGDEPGEAAFSYTVGLTRFNHPEVVTQGLPFDVAQAFLNDIGAQVRAGRRFRHATLVADLTDGGHLAFIEVRDSDELTAVHRVYCDVTALQMIWCDSQGALPWEPGYRNTPEAQPFLGPLPATWSREG